MSDYPIIRQAHIGPLHIVQRSYGVDYYWREKWLLVSAPTYIGWRLKDYETKRRAALFDIHRGLVWYGKHIVIYPKWWHQLKGRLGR